MVEQGTSLLAWRILLEMYATNKSVNSMIMTLCEAIGAMENQGLRYFEMMPSWMDQPLQQLLAMHGIQHIAQFMEKAQLHEFQVLINSVRMANYLQLDNCTNIGQQQH